jgi:serralysin
MAPNTGINSIDSLVYGSWNDTEGRSATVYYSFMKALPADADATDAIGFAPMTAQQQAAARAAMATWEAVARVDFIEQSTPNGLTDLLLGTNDQTALDSSGYAYMPHGAWSPTVALYLNNKVASNSDFSLGSFGMLTLIHELGHSLGLRHPGNYDVLGNIDPTRTYLPAATDNNDYTIMSYTDGDSTAHTGKYDTTPMLYDIQAVQYLYGAAPFTGMMSDTYTFAVNAAPRCIYDAGGNNTFDFSACYGGSTINLNAGGFSSTNGQLNNVSIAFGVNIQQAIGSADADLIFANDAGDSLYGGGGNDTFSGGAGNDLIDGGAGDDWVVFGGDVGDYKFSDAGAAWIVEGEGRDALNGVETLSFADADIRLASLLAGTAGDDQLRGRAGDDSIVGGAGRDTLRYDGARGGYTIGRDATSFSVVDKSGSGVDTLFGVERLLFADVGVALDTGGTGGQAYRLYQAAFNRVPDEGGLGYWMFHLDRGVSLTQVAQSFVDSPEFQHAYGKLSNTAFATQIYANVLHRAPDAGGLSYWVDVLDHGAARAGVLRDFSESPENQAALIGKISDGFAYVPYYG